MDQLKNELIRTGKYMMDYELAWGNSGNISARVNQDSYLVTASGTYMGELTKDELVEVGLNGRVIATHKKPTKETPMHGAVYEVRDDINAVLHSSPFYSMMVSSSNYEIPSNLFIESMYYLSNVERVPYYDPGSEELGQAVREKVKKTNVIILENHGVLVYDTSLVEARMALQTLELACKMLVLSHIGDFKLNGIPQERINRFLSFGVYKPERKFNF